LFYPRYIRFSKWGILFEGGEVGLSMSMLCLLHCSFSRRRLAMLRCPGHYGQCILCHCSTLTNIYTKYVEFPVNAGLCSRLYHNLCNYPETTVSQLNGQSSDRRQIKASYSSLNMACPYPTPRHLDLHGLGLLLSVFCMV
jgi:hypothetical protein